MHTNYLLTQGESVFLPLVTARLRKARPRPTAASSCTAPSCFLAFPIRAIELRGQGLEGRQGESAVFVIIRSRIMKASPGRYLRFQPRKHLADTIDRS